MPTSNEMPKSASSILPFGLTAFDTSGRMQVAIAQLNSEGIVRSPVNWGWRIATQVRRTVPIRLRALRRREAILKSFDDKFEDLIDLLCWAAQNSIHLATESRYCALMECMKRNYSAIKQPLSRHMDSTSVQSTDSFEALFKYASVNEAVASPTTIEDLMLCREALDSYRNELKSTVRSSIQ